MTDKVVASKNHTYRTASFAPIQQPQNDPSDQLSSAKHSDDVNNKANIRGKDDDENRQHHRKQRSDLPLQNTVSMMDSNLGEHPSTGRNRQKSDVEEKSQNIRKGDFATGGFG